MKKKKYCYILEGSDMYEPTCIIDVYELEHDAIWRADKLRKRMEKHTRAQEKYNIAQSEKWNSDLKSPPVPKHNYEHFEVIKHEII